MSNNSDFSDLGRDVGRAVRDAVQDFTHSRTFDEIKRSVDWQLSRLKTDYTQHVRVLRVKLAECKRRNEVNGKLIRLCQASCRRLTSMLMGVRDRMTQSLTYTDKGGMNARQLQRVNISA